MVAEKSNKKISLKLVLLSLTLAIVIFGLVFEPSKASPSSARYVLSNLGQFLIILLAALIGFEGSKFFTLKSSLGKSTFYISLGILCWGFGALLWLYYNLLAKIEVPYPSIADIGFLAIIPLVVVGLSHLLRYAQIKLNFATIIRLSILPFLVLIFTFFFFIWDKLAENVGLLTKILNILYPLGDALFLSISLTLLIMTFGSSFGKVLTRSLLVLSLGFAFEAIADFSFSYTTTMGTYYSGNWVDIIFALAFFTIGVGMYLLHLDHARFIDSEGNP